MRSSSLGRSARTSRLLGTRFWLDSPRFSKLEIRLLRRYWLVRTAMVLLSAATASPGIAQAQSQPRTGFQFYEEVHWGSAVLPPGHYFVSVSADVSPVVTVNQKGGAFTATIIPNAISSEPFSGNTHVVMQDDGDGFGNYVTSLYVKDIGMVLTFFAPNSNARASNPGAHNPPQQDVGSVGYTLA
jgi:hypothetical protein